MSNKISEERKALYYIGMILIVIGFILFISNIFTFGNDDMFFQGPSTFMARPLVGMICIIIGSILMNIGKKGTAGSGLILDPEKAREDLKPHSIAKGKMINDAIENIDIGIIGTKDSSPNSAKLNWAKNDSFAAAPFKETINL